MLTARGFDIAWVLEDNDGAMSSVQLFMVFLVGKRKNTEEIVYHLGNGNEKGASDLFSYCYLRRCPNWTY